jgi:hypothetical protein
LGVLLPTLPVKKDQLAKGGNLLNRIWDHKIFVFAYSVPNKNIRGFSDFDVCPPDGTNTPGRTNII